MSLGSRVARRAHPGLGLGWLAVATLAAFLLSAGTALSEDPNGFSLTGLNVPRSDIQAGGPQRDAIPRVDAPRFVALDEARWVRPDSPVIGVLIDGLARAYPVHLMEWHQLVNDRFGERAVLVTYDPLTDIASAWALPEVEAAAGFGISGLVDRDGFLLYDRGSESLWSSVSGRALSGPKAGASLTPVRARVETLMRWASRHPNTRVLAMPDRERIDYRRSPYSAYWTSESHPLKVRAEDERFHPKEVVLGVSDGKKSRAYVGSVLTRAGGRIVDEFASRRLRVAYEGDAGTFSYEAPDDLTVKSAYWFAWKSLHPDTEIWGEEFLPPTAEPTP